LLRAELSMAGGQDLVDNVKFLKSVSRQVDHDSLRSIARLDREGVFAEHGVYPAPAVADLLRCGRGEPRRLVALAASVFPTGLDGQRLEPKLPVTATVLAGWEIDQAHAEVIERELNTGAARRLDPGRWSAAEAQLADWARTYRSDELARMARGLIAQLDQDGPAPDDDESQVNELHLAKSRDGVGGRVRGQLDSATFEVLARAIGALAKPVADENKSLGERQADALGEICEHALDEGRLPVEGGERPHITAVLDYEALREQARGLILDYGGAVSAADVRVLLCDARITPVVLGGQGEPLDVGRSRRCATPAQRKAVAARDRGCAHPGCDRPPSWCQVHHIVSWQHHGETHVQNLVMLCRTHRVSRMRLRGSDVEARIA